mmetsp:Transcript_101250/g.287079  ORF Transcript_101250/g.287079 Transcript_101250/m.287079 type:complete len:391 (+) Transcript_101250:189-1361(+)
MVRPQHMLVLIVLQAREVLGSHAPPDRHGPDLAEVAARVLDARADRRLCAARLAVVQRDYAEVDRVGTFGVIDLVGPAACPVGAPANRLKLDCRSRNGLCVALQGLLWSVAEAHVAIHPLGATDLRGPHLAAAVVVVLDGSAHGRIGAIRLAVRERAGAIVQRVVGRRLVLPLVSPAPHVDARGDRLKPQCCRAAMAARRVPVADVPVRRDGREDRHHPDLAAAQVVVLDRGADRHPGALQLAVLERLHVGDGPVVGRGVVVLVRGAARPVGPAVHRLVLGCPALRACGRGRVLRGRGGVLAAPWGCWELARGSAERSYLHQAAATALDGCEAAELVFREPRHACVALQRRLFATVMAWLWVNDPMVFTFNSFSTVSVPHLLPLGQVHCG